MDRKVDSVVRKGRLASPFNLADMVAAESGVSITDVVKVLRALPKVVVASFQSGATGVKLEGFGTFIVRVRKAVKDHYVPSIKRRIDIEEKRRLAFRPVRHFLD